MERMNEPLHLDYETRSVLDLSEVGLDRYAKHPSTQVLLAAYAFGDRAVKLWQPHLEPKIPADLEEALGSPWVEAHAWNASFERHITKFLLGIDKPMREWRDPMVNSRYLSLPGSLEDSGRILGVSSHLAKFDTGKRLIRLFCEPEHEGGEESLLGITEPTFRDWRTDPKDWQLFCDYNKQDVVAERAAEKKMRKFPLPEQEVEHWILSEKVNEIGWPVGMDLVRGAQFIVEKEMERLTDRLRKLTGLENANSAHQLLPWLRERGYTFSSVDKNFAARALKGESPLTEEAKEALILRGQTAKSSVKKYTNIADMVSGDGRLRNQYSFYGAARTGRQAAHGVNMGNLPKPVKEVEKKMERAVELVRLMDYERIKEEFKNPLDVVASTVRASFQAPEGFKFVVADLSAIENVGAGFIARCGATLDVFRQDRDPYLDFAVHFFHEAYDKLEAEFKAGDKSKRTLCKPATLGAGFGLGAGDEFLDDDGNKVRTGLLAYAANMGVIMTKEEATRAVQIFRKVYEEIPWTWKYLEKAAIRSIRNPGQWVGVGVPASEKDREWFQSKSRPVFEEPILSFRCHGKKVLELLLPSGRSLHYIDPQVTDEEYEWGGKTIKGEKISYYGKEQNSTTWGRVSTFGGKIFENSDQAWARDILFNGMVEADSAGFEVVGSTYDELITLVPTNSHLGVDELCACMTKKPSWMPEGIPLKAAGYEASEYKKD